MTLNLATLLEDSARRYPDRDAVVLGDTRLTYAQVDAPPTRSPTCSSSRGIQPGDKVALSCPNLPYFPVVYYGILKAGAVVVPLNVLLKGREIAYHLDDSEAKAYFCFEGTPGAADGRGGLRRLRAAPRLRAFFVITADPAAPSPIEGARDPRPGAAGPARDVRDGRRPSETDTAVILYTSGTTGQPKGAELSHSNLVLNALTCNRLFGALPTEHERHLITLPLFHSFGSTVQMNAGFAVGVDAGAAAAVRRPAGDRAAAAGGDHVLRRRADDVLGAARRARPTTSTSTTIARNLRVAVSGGASLPVEIIKQVKDRFGVQILEGYGLSETSPVATFSDPERDPRPGSIGMPDLGRRGEADRRRLEDRSRAPTRSARSRSAATTS